MSLCRHGKHSYMPGIYQEEFQTQCNFSGYWLGIITISKCAFWHRKTFFEFRGWCGLLWPGMNLPAADLYISFSIIFLFIMVPLFTPIMNNSAAAWVYIVMFITVMIITPAEILSALLVSPTPLISLSSKKVENGLSDIRSLVHCTAEWHKQL